MALWVIVLVAVILVPLIFKNRPAAGNAPLVPIALDPTRPARLACHNGYLWQETKFD